MNEQDQPREGFTHVDDGTHEHEWRPIKFGVECTLCGVSFID